MCAPGVGVGYGDLGLFPSPSTKEEEGRLGSGSSFRSPTRADMLWKLKKEAKGRNLQTVQAIAEDGGQGFKGLSRGSALRCPGGPPWMG